jgi:ketosteroid isomerase-like protein
VAAGAELVRQAYVGLARRDFGMLIGLADPDFEMDLTERVLNPATYRGADGVARFLAEVEELWASMYIDVERLLERGDEVLAVLLVKLRGRGSGVELESRIGQHWTMRDGKLLGMRLRVDAEAAVAEFEAAG